MKKSFRLFTLLTFGVLFAFVLAACGGGIVPDVPFDAAKDIQVVCRPATSGTRGAMRDLLEKSDRNFPAVGTLPAVDLRKGSEDQNKVITMPTTSAVMTYVAGEPQAIGYDSNGFVDDTVKKLTVDGKECSIANIKDGSYFLSRPLRVLFDESKFAEGSIQAEFLKFLKSKGAQEKAEAEGYVSASDTAALTAYAKNDSMTGTSVKLTGSTSLQPLMKTLADEFKKIYTNVSVDIGGSGSGDGYACAGGGFVTADFGMISDKVRKTGDTNGESADEFVVANDGIAIIVNLKNTFTNVTKAQLQDLFFVYSNADHPDTTAKVYTTWNSLNA
jgi:phosphate transport system substrate-binding protein